MLTKREAALQMETPQGWRYVFCISGNCPAGGIILTDTREKALPARCNLDHFQRRFANHVFRAA